jgi:hypothetical protein
VKEPEAFDWTTVKSKLDVCNILLERIQKGPEVVISCPGLEENITEIYKGGRWRVEMSTTLHWKPKITEGQSLSKELKFALSRKLAGLTSIDMGREDIPYLFGLLDAGLADAEDLIDAIEQHGEITLWDSY